MSEYLVDVPEGALDERQLEAVIKQSFGLNVSVLKQEEDPSGDTGNPVKAASKFPI